MFDRFRTVGKVMTWLVEHDIRMPVRRQGGAGKGELEWRRVSRPTLLNLFANPIYAGVYGIERVTLYRYVGPKGELRDYGKRVLGLA